MKLSPRKNLTFNAIPENPPSFWENVANEYRYSYLPSVHAIKQLAIGKPDPNFTVTNDMLVDEPSELIDELINSKSQQEYDYHKNLYKRMSNLKNTMGVHGGFGSALFSGILRPENLIPLPGALGVGFAKGALRVGAGSAGITAGTEIIRAPSDPTYQPTESVFAIGGSAFFGGLLGGAIGKVTANRIGKNISNATAYDNGQDAVTKKVKVKGKAPNDKMAKEVTTPVMNIEPNTILKEEGVIPVEEDPRLNAQLDTGYQKTGVGYEFFTRGSTLGNLLHRTNSQLMEDWVISVVGDASANTKKVARGGVPFTRGTVNLNRGPWYGASYGYIEDMRDIWLKSKGIQSPRIVGTQNLSFTAENIRTKINKAESFEEYTERVTKANIKASYFGNDDVIANEPKYVLDGVRLTRSLNERTLQEGQDAGLMNTSKNLNTKMDALAKFSGDRVSKLEQLKSQIPKTTKPQTLKLLIRNEEEALENSLREMHILERFSFSLIRTEKKLYGALDEVLEKIDTDDRLTETYTDIMNKMSKKAGDREKFYKQLSEKIQLSQIQRQERDLKIFVELRKQFEESGLSDDAMKYMEILDDRINNHKYTPKQQKILDEYAILKKDKQAGFSKKQKDFYKKMETQLKEPLEFNVRASINSLKDSIKSINKDFTRPAGENHYTMRKYMTDTIIDKRDAFHNEVIIPYIMENPSGKLAKLIDLQQNGQELIEPATEELAENSLLTRLDLPKEYFKLIKSKKTLDRQVDDIIKFNNKNIYILEDGRYYFYREKDFGSFADRFGKENLDIDTAPLVAKSGLYKKRIKGTTYDAFKYNSNELGDNISRQQLNMLARQARYIDKKYKGKIPNEIYEELIVFSNKRKASNVMQFFDRTTKKKNFQTKLDDGTGLPLPFSIGKKTKTLLGFEDGSLAKTTVTDEMIKKQADIQATKIINKIIGEGDAQDYDGIAGRGLQKFVMHRNFNIPNYFLLKEHNGIADFIDTNGADLMRTYLNKFGPALEMARMFNGDRFGKMKLYEAFDDVILRHSDEIEINAKDFEDRLFYQKDDIEEMTDAILNRSPRGMEIGSASNRIVKAAQQFAQFTMMGTATIAGFADFGKIILSRGIKEVFGRYLISWFRDVESVNLKDASNKHMVRFLGDGMETVSGAGASRVVEQGSGIGEINNRVLGRTGDKLFEFFDKVSGSFYNVNLLNHWTATMKRMVIPMSVDRIIRTGAMVANDYKGDKALKQYLQDDLDILRSFGLEKKDLSKIYNLWKKNGAPKSRDIYYSNADKWMDEDPELFRKYIASVRADVLSTVITPTEADKPLLSYGLFKGERFSKSMKNRQHNIFKLPIQFMSWGLAASNKIVLSTLQGRHQGVASGIMSMFALGMLSDFARNPEWWKYKSTTEKIMKATEYSGITAYLLDINSFAEIASNNYVGIRPMLGQKNPFTGTLPDQISEVGGPAGSIIADIYKLFADDSLELKDQANMVKRMIPYNNIFYLKWMFNGLKDAIVDDNNTIQY